MNQLAGNSSEQYDEEFLSRRRGGLSQDDRELLVGKKEYKHQKTLNARYRDVRDRVRQAILDFPLILEAHEQFGADLLYEDTTGNEALALDEARMAGIGLLYGLGRDTYIGLNRDSPTELAKRGIELGEQLMHNRTVNAELEVTETTVDGEHVAEVLDAGKTELLESHEKAWLLAVLDSSDFSGEELKKTVDALPEDAVAKQALE